MAHQSTDLHPLRLAVSPDGFRGLQEVLDLRYTRLQLKLASGYLGRVQRNARRTSGSESSTRVLSISIASQMPAVVVISTIVDDLREGHAPIRARTVFLKFARTRMLNSTVCFSASHSAEE